MSAPARLWPVHPPVMLIVRLGRLQHGLLVRVERRGVWRSPPPAAERRLVDLVRRGLVRQRWEGGLSAYSLSPAGREALGERRNS